MALLTAENRLGLGPGILRDSTDGIHPYFGAEFISKKKITEFMGIDHIDFDAFEREINELQEDYAALDAANGDYNIAFGSFSGGYTDEQVDEMNRLAELEFFEKNPISDEMVALLEQCMLEEDQAFMDNTIALNDYLVGTLNGPTIQAPVQTLDELHAWRGASLGDVVFVRDECTSYILADASKWLSFSTLTVNYEHGLCSKVSLFDPTMIDAPPSKKILSSRSDYHADAYSEYRTREFASKLRTGKKTLSSRG